MISSSIADGHFFVRLIDRTPLITAPIRYQRTDGIMDIQVQHESLRSQLLKMSKLSQRAVNYSIKAFELGRPEFCHDVQTAALELRNLRFSIADRSRLFLATTVPVSVDSRFACCALRISNALHNTYNSAAAIALETLRGLQGGRRYDSSMIVEMAQFVNSLVRLCTVALFNENLEHARTVLQNDSRGRWFNLSLRQAQIDLAQRSGTQAKSELAIVQSLGQIAEQSYDVAHAITVWLEGKDCPNTTRERAPFFMHGSLMMQNPEQAGSRMRASCGQPQVHLRHRLI
jgi:phosphate uptake regulator